MMYFNIVMLTFDKYYNNNNIYLGVFKIYLNPNCENDILASCLMSNCQYSANEYTSI